MKQLRVDWDKLIWFLMAIPKHVFFSFFLWLAVKEYLSTGDRLLKWGLKVKHNVCFVGVALNVVITCSFNVVLLC